MNRLATESSPYLLQHADNPVSWRPWGEAAFAEARAEDKPIFLSIGYSTCHWCHVMAHESFEDPAVAEVLNAHFVPIKVDREERPDVDRVYMTFVQTLTGAGGWPMSVWLTPDLKPFFGGTYFPPAERWGRPGFVEILREIARAWTTERARVDRTAEELTVRLREATVGGLLGTDRGVVRQVAGVAALHQGVAQHAQQFDARHGGFGGAPKFPRPSELLFLLREHARTGDASARRMALETLDAMAGGGVRDHLGGGFHRYSVDAAWRVPHFEKMLYDQAQLVMAYLEAGQVSGDRVYLDVARDTIAYVRDVLTSDEGGFFSAEDADSLPHDAADPAHTVSSEGAFYLWSRGEIDEALGADAEIVRLFYGVETDGNAPQDPQGEFTGKNILYRDQPIEAIAARTGKSADEILEVVARARRLLHERREKRPRPGLDDKVLTAWNGLMIAALARAGRVLGPDAEGRGVNAAACEGMAVRAWTFVRDRLWDEASGCLLRRYRAGDAAIPAYAEDYASLVWGLVELVETTGDANTLEWAVRLQARQDALFWDDEGSGWFATTADDPSVIVRLKDDYDGAEPAAGSLAVQNLIRLGHLTGDGGMMDRAERALARFGEDIGRGARAVPMLMAALSLYRSTQRQIVVVGDAVRDSDLWRALAGVYLPSAVVLPITPGPGQRALADLVPGVAQMTPVDGRAAAYVCRDFVCEAPVTDAEDLTRRVTA